MEFIEKALKVKLTFIEEVLGLSPRAKKFTEIISRARLPTLQLWQMRLKLSVLMRRLTAK